MTDQATDSASPLPPLQKAAQFGEYFLSLLLFMCVN